MAKLPYSQLVLSSFLSRKPQPLKALWVLLGLRFPGPFIPSRTGGLLLASQSRSGPWEAKEPGVRPTGHRLGTYPTHCDGTGHSNCIQGSLVFGALQSLTSIPSVNPAIGKPLSENQMVYLSLHTDETAGTQTSGLSPEGHLPTAAWCLPPV